MNELNGIYSNQATPYYINHIVQDWNNEPFIKAEYMTDNTDKETVIKLGESVADKIYFAGGPSQMGMIGYPFMLQHNLQRNQYRQFLTRNYS